MFFQEIVEWVSFCTNEYLAGQLKNAAEKGEDADKQNTLFNGVEKSKGVYDNVGNTVCKGYISADYTLEINISIMDILLKDLDKELQILSVEMVNIKG